MKTTLQRFVEKYPIYTCVILFFLAMSFRVNDIFVLKLDEIWGEIALSKMIGFFIIIAFLYLMRNGIKDVGLHFENFNKNMFYGLGLIIIPFIFAYIFEILYLKFNGYSPELFFSAINDSLNGIGVKGGFIFGVWLILGNVINSFMEEGLFRGIMINVSSKKFTKLKANIFQALLFGLWHIVWPIKAVITGSMSVSNAVVFAVGYIILSGLIGFTFGLLYIGTNSLWGAFFAHTFNNTVLNFVHVRTSSGVNEFQNIRVILITIIFLALVLLTKKHYLSKNV